MRAYERLLEYVKVYTASCEDSRTTPSTKRQLELAKQLKRELEGLGVQKVRLDEKGYVYGIIPADQGLESAPAIGFIAHMDTAPDFPGEGVAAQVITNYNGKNVVLGESGRTLSVKEFPHLKALQGRTLITTDGTTLLGADDKAGIAEIMTLAEELTAGKLPHGTVCIGFTPDEEIGRGADAFDVEGFGAEFAYTVDGGAENEIEYENFNACAVKVSVQGRPVHPGSGKDTMINAALVAMEFNGMLPSGDTPRHTEEYEGFFHLCSMSGNVSEAALEYIVRDHSFAMYQCRQRTLRHIAKLLCEKYGEGTVKLEITEQYRNMKEKIEPCLHLIENAKEAICRTGRVPFEVPIRGGTDGAKLSYMGLPCPNLGTGGYAFHGPYEHITAEGMDAAVEVLKGIVRKYAQR
ncbi:MAG: peptidase T [Eubacteriales bacterium]|nr:peptidase T [Eubacteriales bacterium]